MKNNGSVEIIAGLDFKTTDPQSMHYLIQLQKSTHNLKFYCYGDKDVNKNSIVFHPKIYLFQGKRETTGIVGSTNLTGGGLMTNFEANGKVMGWVIADQWIKKKFTAVGFLMWQRLKKYFEPMDIVCLTRHNQTSNTGVWHNRARQFNFYLRGFKYLFIMRKPENK